MGLIHTLRSQPEPESVNHNTHGFLKGHFKGFGLQLETNLTVAGSRKKKKQ